MGEDRRDFEQVIRVLCGMGESLTVSRSSRGRERVSVMRPEDAVELMINLWRSLG